MRHRPVSVALMLSILVVVVWASVLAFGPLVESAAPYPFDAQSGAQPQSPHQLEAADQHVLRALPGAMHHASWSFLMTVPQR